MSKIDDKKNVEVIYTGNGPLTPAQRAAIKIANFYLNNLTKEELIEATMKYLDEYITKNGD